MFHETLLESAPLGRKRKRWPMAVAVTLEAIVCSALIALPLLSSGVIPVAAHPQVPVPLNEPPRIAQRPTEAHPSIGGGRGMVSHAEVVTFAANQGHPCFLNCPDTTKDTDVSLDATFGGASRELPGELASCTTCRGPGPAGPARISTLTPGALVYRVEPVYPRPAAITLTRGVVRLHAIIATDGSIQSLNVIEGPPLLVEAAREAVRQWRYRPYILNGRPVEVETIITVNFKGAD